MRLRIAYGYWHLSVVVSVRVPKEVREILERHGVNVAELIRKILLEEARKVEEEELWEKVEELAERARDRIDPSEWAEAVREDMRR